MSEIARVGAEEFGNQWSTQKPPKTFNIFYPSRKKEAKGETEWSLGY